MFSIFIMNFPLVAMRVNYHSHNMSGVIFSAGHRFFILYKIMNEKIFPRNSPTFWGSLKKQCCCVLSSLQFLSHFKPTIQERKSFYLCCIQNSIVIESVERSDSELVYPNSDINREIRPKRSVALSSYNWKIINQISFSSNKIIIFLNHETGKLNTHRNLIFNFTALNFSKYSPYLNHITIYNSREIQHWCDIILVP